MQRLHKGAEGIRRASQGARTEASRQRPQERLLPLPRC
nr:MAG TPA_asm: hypothetical protein [Caudoviricetes sp.]